MSTTTAADVQAAPAQTSFQPEPFGRGVQRVIEYAWPVGEPDADGTQIVVDLYCSHITGAYVASVQNRSVRPDGSFEWQPLNDARVDRVPTKRYSKGGLTDFAARALRTFRERAAAGEFGEFLRGEKV